MKAEMEKKVQEESRRSEIRSLENTLKALDGVTDDQIEEAKQNYMATRYAEELGYESAFVLESEGHDTQVDTEVSISADDLDVTELTDAEFEDLKQRLLGLAKDRNEESQKIISEDELEDYLENGWRYID